MRAVLKRGLLKLLKSKLKRDFMNFTAELFMLNLCVTIALFLGGDLQFTLYEFLFIYFD